MDLVKAIMSVIAASSYVYVGARVYSLWLVGKIRIIDWFGFIGSACGLAAGVWWLITNVGPWGWMVSGITILAATLLTIRDIRAIREGKRKEKLFGAFLSNRKPIHPHVRNWITE